MTLTQAIDSGLPYKRPHNDVWRYPESTDAFVLTKQDIFADDWETLDQAVTVSLDQLREAWTKAGLAHLLEIAAFDAFCRAISMPGYGSDPTRGEIDGKKLGKGLGAIFPGVSK